MLKTLLGSTLELKRDPLGTFERAMYEQGDVARIVLGPPGARQVLNLVHPPGRDPADSGDQQSQLRQGQPVLSRDPRLGGRRVADERG